MSLKLNKDKVNQMLEQSGIELMSNYINANTNATFFTQDGYLLYGKVHNIKNLKNVVIVGRTNPYSIYNIATFLVNNNLDFIVMETEYLSATEKIRLKCNKCGNIITRSWNTLQTKKKVACEYCLDKADFGIDSCSRKLNLINPNLIILSNEYKNASTQLTLTCSIHPHETFNYTWGSLLSGSNCPKCTREKMRQFSGSGAPSWKGGVSPLIHYIRRHLYDWKYQSMIECGFKCVVTGKKFDVVHHIHGFNMIFDEAILNLKLNLRESISHYTQQELDDVVKEVLSLHEKYGLGACLSKNVHKEFHKIYGNKNNTSQQWNEFYRMKITNS